MLVTQFDYHLPAALIAHSPLKQRDQCRLLVVDREQKKFSDRSFTDLELFLSSGDLLVLNNTKVYPARIFAHKDTGGLVEVLLLDCQSEYQWLVFAKGRLRTGLKLQFTRSLVGVVREKKNDGSLIIEFNFSKQDLLTLLERVGQTPLPPYIHNSLAEEEKRLVYQTIYAREAGSVAAPTAGLHFTHDLLKRLRDQGVNIATVTLHVGAGTFAKLKNNNVQDNQLHYERYLVNQETSNMIEATIKAGKRIIAVGTTTARALESWYLQGKMKDNWLTTNLFIYPPFRFRLVQALITNFHLPKSSLLMMVSAFASWPNSGSSFNEFSTSLLAQAYRHAVINRYRFFSFGDAMMIV